MFAKFCDGHTSLETRNNQLDFENDLHSDLIQEYY